MVRNLAYLGLWSELAETIRRAGHEQTTTVDEPGRLRLETARRRPFCEARVQKGHVGVYIIALIHLGLELPPQLEEHRTGRGTLRFRSVTAEVLFELEAFLTNLQGLVGQW